MTDKVFVAREPELAQLGQYLDRALAGQGQVCFVAGDAGSGKTALVREFAHRSQKQHEALIVAAGQGDAETGAGDPYLPFREVLGQLTGDVEGDVARGTITQENAGRLRKFFSLSLQALIDVGPDLIGIFVPGAGIAVQVGAFAADKVGLVDKMDKLIQRPRGEEDPSSAGLGQDNIFEQYTNVVRTLAGQQPLILVLDDLQWADGASIGLLFRLGRRIGDSRVLIVGTYRPDEVAMGRAGERHPLEKVLAEFKRYHGQTTVELGQAGEAEEQQFVDAILDTEPNALGDGFRQALYDHTAGHALFTIELLRDMQERGNLVRDAEGRWIEGSTLNWGTLPARVEGVIDERIGRLGDELRQVLDVASVEGERFTAEVVADVQAENVRGLVRRLSSELDRKHRLVNAQGIRRIGTGRRLSNYRFQHNLFQAYLYDNLDEVERAILHEDIGTALENLYGDLVEEITVDLARHFTEAGIPEQAAKYLRLAGEQAAAQYANDEAVSYLSRALEMVAESDLTERYDLLRTRERVYGMQGARTAQKQDLDTQAELAAVLDETRPQATGSRRAEVALRQAVFAEATGDYETAVADAERAIDLAEPVLDTVTETAAYLCWGKALWQQGDCDCARSPLERARVLAHGAGLRQEEAGSLHNLGIVFGLCGDLGEAQAHIEIALETYREIGDRQGEGLAVNTLGVIAAQQGDYARAKERFEQALHVSRDIGDRRGEGAALGNVGQVCSDQGLYGEARRYLESALAICREIEDREGEGAMLTNLGVIAGELGDHGAAKDYFEQAVFVLHETGNRRVEGFALGGLGLVLLRLGDYGPAGECLERGLSILREIDDPQGEGLVLAYRGLLYHRLGDDEAAREASEEAAQIAEAVSDRATQACALTHLGHALVGLDGTAQAADKAEDAYLRALEIRQELGQLYLAIESRAGLARQSVAQGDLDGALAQVDEVLDYLETGTLDGALEPFRVYLTCVQVLDAAQDPRAAEIKRRARQRLGEQAAGIRDRKMRESFLNSTHAAALRDL